jgi:hypothetical protein
MIQKSDCHQEHNKLSPMMLGLLPESYWPIVSTTSIQWEDTNKLPLTAAIAKIILDKLITS